jgi:transcriptional regulator with AAA-type ATPase domain
VSLPAPEALLVDHPALAVPSVGENGVVFASGRRFTGARLSRRQRIRLALQLTAAAALLAEFDLWPGRRSLAHARFVDNGAGLQAVIMGLPRPLSRVWRRLGGNEDAADATHAAVVTAVVEATGLQSPALEVDGPTPGFFLGPQLEALLRELPRPLDPITARNLWALRWRVPPLPADGEVVYWSVPQGALANRFGAAMWSHCRRTGTPAWVWRVGDGVDDTGPLPRTDASGTLVVTGRPSRHELEVAARWAERPECSAVVIGAFPEGWSPPPPPGFDVARLPMHMALAGIPPHRCRLEVERRGENFDPFGDRDRSSLTEDARWLFEDRQAGVPVTPQSALTRILGLVPEGVPEGFVLVHTGKQPESLRRQATEMRAVVDGNVWRLSNPPPLRPDPLHREAADLFPLGDARRLRHLAMADGDVRDLMGWARERLSELDGAAVRELLSPIAPGSLGIDLQLVLAEACLSDLDIAGAHAVLSEVDDSCGRPWRTWLEVTDAPQGFVPELPDAEDVTAAARPTAEVALYLLRRAVRQGDGDRGAPRARLESSCEALHGPLRRRFELELAALCFPDSLWDRGWRRRVVGRHPALRRRWLHLSALRLAEEKRYRAARRLLRLAGEGERSPARQGFLELDLGFLAMDQVRSRDVGLHLLRSYRLIQAAGFRHRTHVVLFNLAVCDLDQLEVERAGSRLRELDDSAPSNDRFVVGERVRLALARGDESAFRHLLAKYPVEATATDTRFDENLFLLRGVEALLSDDIPTARRLFETTDMEGRNWMELASALESQRPPHMDADGWGVHRAAELVWLARSGRADEARASLPVSEQVTPQTGFALALTERLIGRQPWIERPFRQRAVCALDSAGMTGWARVLRGRRPEAEPLIAALAHLVDGPGPEALAEDQVLHLVAALGIEGLEVRSGLDGQAIWRWGRGEPGPSVNNGRLEVVPLGGDPTLDPAWRLLVGLLDLMVPERANAGYGAQTETGIHGSSLAIERVRREIEEVARTGFGVVLRGETGVGKEVAARALHRLSGRSGRFVPVNVAAMPGELLEAELFGSVRGAFTGADRSRQGLVDAADGGTLFLDEIGDLDLTLQVKLLRFLESQEVRPVGSNQFHTVDVRIVSATHQDLDRRVAEGSFRPDLYYRICTLPITIPPLRDRTEDIPVLKSLFQGEAVERTGLSACRWSQEAESVLLRYHWPGNVRELRHIVGVAMVRAAGGTVLPAHLPIDTETDIPRGRWDDALTDFKRRFLSAALRRNQSNRSATARELGISRQALLYHIRNLGLRNLSK